MMTTIPTNTRTFPSSPFQNRSSRPEDQTARDIMLSSSPSRLDQSNHGKETPNKRSPTKHTARIPSDNYLPTSRLLRSPGKHLSPAKIPLPPSPIRFTSKLPEDTVDRVVSPTPTPAVGDESCLMPTHRYTEMNTSQSMIGDMSMPELLSLEMDESSDFKTGLGREFQTTRAKDRRSPTKAVPTPRRERSPTKTTNERPLPTPSRSFTSPIKAPSTSSPSKVKRTFPASSSHNLLSCLGEEAALDVSTILPRSPTRFGHLMGDEHQLLRQSLPMSEGDSILFDSPPMPIIRKTPRAAKADMDMSTILPRSPTRMAHLMGDEYQLMRQSLPMSEGDSILFDSPPLPTIRKTPRAQLGDMDVSTFLPRSPTRMAHLMGDEHQIMRQSLPMSEGDSELFLPPPPIMSRRSPRKQASPIKDSDMTLDVGQMMARMAKPKRPSGTEESFEDLMHGSAFDLDDVIGNILPADLRPRTKSLGMHVRTTSASVKTMDLVRSPAKLVDHTSSDRHRSVLSSPVKTQSNHSPRRLPTTGTTGPASLQPTMAPLTSRLSRTPTSTRRPSLSAGALPMPTASHPKMELFRPTAQKERTRSAMHPADIISAQRETASARPRTEVITRPALPTSKPTAVAVSLRSMMPPPSRPAVPRAGAAKTGSSAVPNTSRAVPVSRVTQSGSMGPPSRPSGFRPTSMAPPAPKSSLPPTSTRTVATTSLARPGLTRPSAPASTARTFGADGTAQTNRVVRPAASTAGGLTKPSSRIIPGKMSMAPISPSKRDTALKSRAASTPADVVARSLVRPSATKSSIPPATTRPVAGTTALPRPGASRMPIPSASKLSAGAGVGANRRGDSTQINALRARIDAISARQAIPRRP